MSSNTESNFRNAFKNFGARGGVAATDSTTASSSNGPLNRASSWFGGVRSQVSGYVPVSLGGGSQPQEEDWLGLSWFQVTKSFTTPQPTINSLTNLLFINNHQLIGQLAVHQPTINSLAN